MLFKTFVMFLVEILLIPIRSISNRMIKNFEIRVQLVYFVIDE